jgi:hypothetical protein
MPKLLEGGATRIVCGLNEEIKKSLHDLFITAYYHLLFDFTVSLASYDFFPIFLACFLHERAFWEAHKIDCAFMLNALH